MASRRCQAGPDPVKYLGNSVFAEQREIGIADVLSSAQGRPL